MTQETQTYAAPGPVRPDPTLREFLVDCLYPALLAITRWIARRYGLRAIEKP